MLVASLFSSTYSLPMDRSRPLLTLLTDLKKRFSDGVIRLRFCDAYEATKSYVRDARMQDGLSSVDPYADDGSLSTVTLSLICTLHSLSTHLPKQTEFLTRLWANTMEAVVRTEPCEVRSHHSFLDTFLRMFSSWPTKEMLEEKTPYHIHSMMDELIQMRSSYYVVQRLLDQFYFDLGFNFHDGYINALTLGLSCFLRITHGQPHQRQMVFDYLMKQTMMNASPRRYYDYPEDIQEEYTFSL